jgi:hypothetical protein
VVAFANKSGALQNCEGVIDGTKIAIARPKTGKCAFLAGTSFTRIMFASSVYFLRASTGAPTPEDEPVTIRFGTTAAPDSESLKEAFSASDKLRRGVKPDGAYRAGQQGNERDDEIPHRETG